MRGGSTKAAEVRRCCSNVDPEATILAQFDDLLTATYVLVDAFLPKRRGPCRPPRITDAELITLAIAQVFMGLPNDRQFLALAGYRLSHLFAYLPCQSGYNKRLRALTHRSSERSTTSPSARRGGAISCGCSIRPRSPARPRARRFGAPSSRGSQPTATAALTRATSGAFASICSARATGPRSPSSSPRQMLPSERSRARCSSGSR